jgi:hypothetical protein
MSTVNLISAHIIIDSFAINSTALPPDLKERIKDLRNSHGLSMPEDEAIDLANAIINRLSWPLDSGVEGREVG